MTHKTIVSILASLALAPAAFADHDVQINPQLGGALPGLTAQEQALFQQGKADFEHNFTIPEGAGPIMNAPSCATCHGGGVNGSDHPGNPHNGHNLTLRHDGS